MYTNVHFNYKPANAPLKQANGVKPAVLVYCVEETSRLFDSEHSDSVEHRGVSRFVWVAVGKLSRPTQHDAPQVPLKFGFSKVPEQT